MSEAGIDDHQLKRYLLGDLPEAERDRVEVRMLEDPDLSEAMAAMETDLIDAYARSELNPEERAGVERNLLATPAQRARLASAVALQKSLRGVVPMRRRRTWIPLAAAAAIAIAVGVAIFAPQRERVPTERVVTTPPVSASTAPAEPSPAPIPAPPPPLVQTLVLAGAVTRSADVLPAVTLLPDADALRLDVELLEGEDEKARYRMLVQRIDGTAVAEETMVPVARRLSVEIPRPLVERTEHEVLVFAGDELIAQHGFVVR